MRVPVREVYARSLGEVAMTDNARPGKCPHCPAEYSTAIELGHHLDSRWRHLDERLAEAERSLAFYRQACALLEAQRDWSDANMNVVREALNVPHDAPVALLVAEIGRMRARLQS